MVEGKGSAEVKELTKKFNWDKGCLVFGALMSESTVKIWTATKLLCSRPQDFGWPHSETINILADFDATAPQVPTGTGPANTDAKFGIWSNEWDKITEGRRTMAVLAVDGQWRFLTSEIVKWLATTYPDKTLSAADQKEVLWWCDLNNKYSEDTLFVMVKHWGFADFHRKVTGAISPDKSKNYDGMGKGQMPLAKEKELISRIDEFFSTIEDKLKKKSDNSPWLVGGKQTLADSAMVNWYLSSYAICNLNVEQRYPTVAKFYQRQQANGIPGAEEFYKTFPMMGKFMHVLHASDRGVFCCGGGVHDINRMELWNKN